MGGLLAIVCMSCPDNSGLASHPIGSGMAWLFKSCSVVVLYGSCRIFLFPFSRP